MLKPRFNAVLPIRIVKSNVSNVGPSSESILAVFNVFLLFQGKGQLSKS